MHQPKEQCSQPGSGTEVLSQVRPNPLPEAPNEHSPSYETPAQPGTSEGGSERALCAAAGAQAGGFAGTVGMFALPSSLGSSSASRQGGGGGSGDGQRLLPDVWGFPCWKASGGPSPPWGRDAGGRAAVPQLVALAGLSLLATLGQEVPAGEKAPRRGFAH